MAKLPVLDISLPRRIDIGKPAELGPSVFPNSIDQLKLINYSSVPAGGQIESDLENYYRLMAKVASNTASEQDLVSMKSLMVRIREYIVTEDDFNLMADSVRTTQEFMLNSLEAEGQSFDKIAEVAQQLSDNLNDWSQSFQDELARVGKAGTVGAPVVFGSRHPGSSALGYLWVDSEISENYIAPTLSFDPDNPI